MALSSSTGSIDSKPSFLDCLARLDEFDKLCSQQKLPAKFENFPEDRKQKIKAKIENSKEDALSKEKELLSKFSDNSEEYPLLVEILKNIKIRQGILEKSGEKPDFHSKYAPHFNQKLYYEILPYCQLAHLYEQNGKAAEHAEKLAVLFDSVKDILEYLDIQSKQDKKNQTKNLVHDACLFELRDLDEISPTSWNRWKSFVKNDKGNTAFIMEILPNAKAIEELIASHYSEEKKPVEVKKSTQDLIKKIAEVNQNVKKLSSRAANLDENEEKILESERQALSELKLALFEACKGLALQDLNIAYLSAFNQKILSNLGSFSYLVSKIGEQNYHRFKKLKAKREKNYREHNCEGNNDIYIPNITIDGKDIDPNLDGYYLMKVSLQDELQEARAACLGKLTNCCQSLSGEAGDPCAEHGLTSPYGGFYVICKGDLNNPKTDDYLLGQCWAWRSKNDAIVFDSIEVADYDDFHINTVASFFDKLASNIVTKKFTNKVVCGASSGISQLVGFEASLNREEFFRDYNGYCDSQFQRVLQDENAPFYFFSDPLRKEKTIELAKAAIKMTPLIKSEYMCQLLNFIALEIQENRNFDLRDEILAIANEFKKEKEVNDILKGISEYLELNDENIDSVIERVKEKSFSSKTLNQNKESILLALLKKEPMTPNLKEKINDLINSFDRDIINLPDNNGLTPFMRAAQLKDLSLCRKLEEKGADVAAVDRKGKNALFYAYDDSTGNHQETLEFMLSMISEFKLSINSVNGKGETLLMKAAASGDVLFMEKLIEKGANTAIQDDYGFTVLHHVIRDDYGFRLSDDILKKRITQISLYLINKDKGLLNIVDNDNFTPLQWAIYNNLEEVCLKLIEEGTDVNLKDTNGHSPLQWAIYNSLEEVCLKLIEAGADVNLKDNNGYTPLQSAIYNNLEKVSLKLIEMGADVNLKDPEENTLLHLASIKDMPDLSIALIEKGVDFNALNYHNDTALLLTVSQKKTETSLKIIDKIKSLQKQEGFNIQNPEGKTPLHFAIINKMEEVCLSLIETGVDLNLQDDKGKTPLHWAIDNNLEEVCLKLIEAGADVNLKDTNGLSPLHWAIHNNLEEVCLKLIEAKADVNLKDIEGYTPLESAIYKNLEKVSLKLIEMGPDINLKDAEENTLLHLASRYGTHDVLIALIEKGADINALNHNHETPLHLANRAQISLEIIDKIKSLNKEKGFNIQNSEGKTPLQLAINRGMKEVCLKLIEAGADVNLKDNQGKTALQFAIENSLPDICLELIKKSENIDYGNFSSDSLLDLVKKQAFSYDLKAGKMLEVYIALAKAMGKAEELSRLSRRNEEGDILLHEKIEANEEQICLMIIQNAQNAENFDHRDHEDNTALHLAAKERMIDVCLALIEKEADINARDASGNTPLHLAIADNQSLQFGREVFEQNLGGVAANAPQIIFMKKRQANISDITLTLVSALIKNGANVNTQNHDGKSPLYLAIENNAPEICALLIENGAIVDKTIINFANEKGIKIVPLKEDKRSSPLMLSKRGSFESGIKVEKENEGNKVDKDPQKPSI